MKIDLETDKFNYIAVISYLAGIIDGEGSIGIEHLSPDNKSRKKDYYNCRLTVINTDEPLMKLLKTYFGGSYDQRKKIDGRKICYRWHVFGKRLETAINELIPHLRIKKPQALIVMQYRKTVGKQDGMLLMKSLLSAESFGFNVKH